MSTGNINPKLIESIPPAVLQTLPAGQPPVGIEPNFAHPSTRVPVVLGVGIVFSLLAVFCFSVRIYTRLIIKKKWKWDDGASDTDAWKLAKLTVYTSDLLFRFRERFQLSSRSTQTSNTVLQMCSIVYFVVFVNGEGPRYSSSSSYTDHPQGA